MARPGHVLGGGPWNGQLCPTPGHRMLSDYSLIIPVIRVNKDTTLRCETTLYISHHHQLVTMSNILWISLFSLTRFSVSSESPSLSLSLSAFPDFLSGNFANYIWKGRIYIPVPVRPTLTEPRTSKTTQNCQSSSPRTLSFNLESVKWGGGWCRKMSWVVNTICLTCH